MNWKVARDFVNKDLQYKADRLKQKAEYELQLIELRKEMEDNKKVIE